MVSLAKEAARAVDPRQQSLFPEKKQEPKKDTRSATLKALEYYDGFPARHGRVNKKLKNDGSPL